MRSWIGEEPQLGIIVLLVSVPIVGAILYVVGYGIIEYPRSLVPFAAGYALYAFSTFGFARLPAKLRGLVEKIYAWALIAITLGWLAWFMIRIGRDQGPLTLLTMLAFGLSVYTLTRFAAKRADNIDYHHR